MTGTAQGHEVAAVESPMRRAFDTFDVMDFLGNDHEAVAQAIRTPAMCKP